MPRLSTQLPKYRKHKASKQAVVTLNCRDFYLGPHGTKASRTEYDRLIEEWLANGRQVGTARSELKIVELCVAFMKHAQKYYVKDGRHTSEVAVYRRILKDLRELYGRENAEDFRVRQFKTVRQRWIDSGLARRTVNSYAVRLANVFKWAFEELELDPKVYERLKLISSLRQGKSEAPETEPVKPIDPSIVLKTLPHMRKVPSDMVRFQLLTGCRPGEACKIKPCEIDLSGEVWEYRQLLPRKLPSQPS